jgi:hypothetical protein
VSRACRADRFARRGARIRWYAGSSETDASGCKKTSAVRNGYLRKINRAAHPTGPMTTPLPHDPTPDTLVQLLDRVASEDAAALRALYDLTSSKLFGLALRILVKREWAEEVLQDAFVNIWRYAGDYKAGLSAPMTWMAAIVRNRALDYLRRQKANGAGAETGKRGRSLRANVDEPGSTATRHLHGAARSQSATGRGAGLSARSEPQRSGRCP